MSLLHLSISVTAPERVARFLAQLLGGQALVFPPFSGCWIAFTARDDGTATEVYPTTHVLQPGTDQIRCDVTTPDMSATFVLAAIASPQTAAQIIALATAQNWISRRCNRGPFDCIEVWLEGRVLIQVLDPDMQRAYRAGMTARNWADMFGLDQ